MGLYMGQQEHGISDGLYTYKHHRGGGADIHVIFVKKSKFRVLLSYIGTMFLLATVCCALLSKDSLCLGSLWSISFASIIAKCLRCDPVKKVLQKKEKKRTFLGIHVENEYRKVRLCAPYVVSSLIFVQSLVIMLTFGVQLEQHFWSGRVHRKFVPIGKILKPILNEHVTPVSCYWSLALLLREEYELMLVFKNLNPPVKMLVPIWKALCAFVDSNNNLGNSALPQST